MLPRRPVDEADGEPTDLRPPCQCCRGRMIVIEVPKRWRQPRGPPEEATRNQENQKCVGRSGNNFHFSPVSDLAGKFGRPYGNNFPIGTVDAE